MLDIAYIRENLEKVGESAKNKNVEVDLESLLELDDKRRALIAKVEALRSERNEISSSMKGGKPESELIEKGRQVKTYLSELEPELDGLESEYITAIKAVPNVASDDTPVGATEDENKVQYEWGDKPNFDFEPKNHWEIAEEKGWIDKERASKVAGARFAYLKGPLVQMQLALMQYTFGVLTDEETLGRIIDEAGLGVPNKPFEPILPPYMIKTDMYDAMDRLEPSEDRYKIEGEELWLQGSAEHVLGSMLANEVIPEDQLPMRMVGYATSFRKEAGTYGKDMEGIIRMHQFDKLEMEIISTAEQGLDEHMLTIAIQEYLLRQLKLPYRKLLKCTADIGKPNARGVDMDVWLPGQGKYRETHTADYMTDYQSRRLKTRSKNSDGQLQFVHTIDATAFALGRALVGILENYQNQDGTITVPEVLRPFMNGREAI